MELLALPQELLVEICGHLQCPDLHAVRETCHQLRDAVPERPSLIYVGYLAVIGLSPETWLNAPHLTHVPDDTSGCIAGDHLVKVGRILHCQRERNSSGDTRMLIVGHISSHTTTGQKLCVEINNGDILKLSYNDSGFFVMSTKSYYSVGKIIGCVGVGNFTIFDDNKNIVAQQKESEHKFKHITF